jgi:hypothetical protein
MGKGKSASAWFRTGWLHRHHRRKARFVELRALHGDNCWRCNKPMRFGGPPNCGKAATIEHLTPRCQGGTGTLDNLRLCHVGCNRHLGAHSREQKERMRINLPQDPAG